MVHRYEITLGGRTLSIETGKLAGQANGAVMVRYGDTIVHAAATASKEARPDIDFFPLTVDYEERMYAAGKIPGGFFKREGRPSENAILTCRLTDRPIRPLFPNGFRNDVQVIIATLSADQENEPDILAIIAASAALTISDIPFEGPLGASRVGYIGGQFILNPTASQLAQSELELTVAGTADAVAMVEAGAQELPESVMLEAIKFGQAALQDIVQLQNRMRAEIGKPKFAFTPAKLNPAAVDAARAVSEQITAMIFQSDKASRDAARSQVKAALVAKLGDGAKDKEIAAAIEEVEAEIFRKSILEKGLRPDGRDTTTIRPISCEVGILPRTHGSGLFTRGQTQVLTIATLGSTSEEQTIDGLGPNETKRFIHHYNFPPYSVGEVRRVGSPGRREIGHGALAERAVFAVIPPVTVFPYTIRLVSEVMSSNGSSSMGSVCGSTLALMDAGVPIKAPVAGAAMGLISGDDGKFVVLTDIQGLEDHLGDMDFKVAGTTKGVTALQMDIKIKGLSYDVMEKALAQANDARLFILGKMLEAITETRPELSPYAPRIFKSKIPVDKIGALIGPGGKTIRGLQEEHKVKIDVEEDGTVYISGVDPEGAKRAQSIVDRLGQEVVIGNDYLGKVTRITNFGCFVEILPGKEGLVRLGELSTTRIARAEDEVSLGDEIMVRVIEIDAQGRINLSRRAVLGGGEPSEEGEPGEGGGERRPPFGGGDRRPPFGGGERRPYGERRPFGDREGGERRPPFGGGERRPFGGGEGGRGPGGPGGPGGPDRGPRRPF